MLHPVTQRLRLVVFLAALSVVALVFVGRWLNATKIGGQQPAEPFRIKVVETLKPTTREERVQRLEEAGMNLFKIPADSIYVDHANYARPKLSMLPSELIRRQCAATFMYDPVAINNRHTTGLDTLMWGNDYPHPEGTWPESQARNADQFDGVPDDEVRAIVGGNAARVFGFAV